MNVLLNLFIIFLIVFIERFNLKFFILKIKRVFLIYNFLLLNVILIYIYIVSKIFSFVVFIYFVLLVRFFFNNVL